MPRYSAGAGAAASGGFASGGVAAGGSSTCSVVTASRALRPRRRRSRFASVIVTRSSSSASVIGTNAPERTHSGRQVIAGLLFPEHLESVAGAQAAVRDGVVHQAAAVQARAFLRQLVVVDLSSRVTKTMLRSFRIVVRRIVGLSEAGTGPSAQPSAPRRLRPVAQRPAPPSAAASSAAQVARRPPENAGPVHTRSPPPSPLDEVVSSPPR